MYFALATKTWSVDNELKKPLHKNVFWQKLFYGVMIQCNARDIHLSDTDQPYSIHRKKNLKYKYTDKYWDRAHKDVPLAMKQMID